MGLLAVLTPPSGGLPNFPGTSPQSHQEVDLSSSLRSADAKLLCEGAEGILALELLALAFDAFAKAVVQITALTRATLGKPSN